MPRNRPTRRKGKAYPDEPPAPKPRSNFKGYFFLIVALLILWACAGDWRLALNVISSIRW